MASELSGGRPDSLPAGGGTTSSSAAHITTLDTQHQLPYQSPLAEISSGTAAQIRPPDFIGKRSFVDYQLLNQQGLMSYHRSLKLRPNRFPVDFSPVPSFSREFRASNYAHQLRPQNLGFSTSNESYGFKGSFSPYLPWNMDMGTDMKDVFGSDSEKKTMIHRLKELEKELLGDDEESVSVITDGERPETNWQLICQNPSAASQSPTMSSSSSSSGCFSSASPQILCTKQSFMDAADAISDRKFTVATEILTRLQQVVDTTGNPEQRLTAYMVSALRQRVDPTERTPPVSELYSAAHSSAIQMLYRVSPCFKLGFVAANIAILESATEQGSCKIHIVDFHIGQGGQYAHFLQALAARKTGTTPTAEVKITALIDFIPGGEEKHKIVGGNLKTLADKIGVQLNFSVKDSKTADLSREILGIEPDETLAVTLAFILHQLPDESVSLDNPRDNLLRRVRSLSPAVTTVVEQDLNGNTSPLTVRVRENYDYYSALFGSLETAMARDNPDRVRVEEALGQKMGNSVACEGIHRVERCELFGKWRARMSMAGFEAMAMSPLAAESVRVRLNEGTRGNPGFSVFLESGGLCFGWMGRTLTVTSAWR